MEHLCVYYSNCHSDSHGKDRKDSNKTVYWYNEWNIHTDFKGTSTRIPMQPSVKSALRSSLSLHLEPTNFRYRRKPSAICSVHHAAESLSHACLQHHNKPHSNRTAENKEAIFINLSFIYFYLFKKKKKSKNYVDSLCFIIILSWTTEQLCLHVFHVYNVLYI